MAKMGSFLRKQFYLPAQLHGSVAFLKAHSLILLIGLALCQVGNRRTGQHCTPHPFQPAGSWSLPWILKQTGCVLWLLTQTKRVGGATNISAM